MDINLRYDTNGVPHIAYRDRSQHYYVKYARPDNSNWELQYIDPTPYLGSGRVAMALDSLNLPHIIYQVLDGKGIAYASYDSQNWTITIADSFLSSNSTYKMSMEFDKQGNAHFCYAFPWGPNYSFPDQITYNKYNGVVFGNRTQVYSVYTNGKWNSLAIDKQNRPSITFWMDNGDFAFSYLDNTIWKTELVDSNGFIDDQGYFVSMKIGSDSTFYISFQNHTTSMLCLAHGRPGKWILEDVATLTGWGFFETPNPLELDPQDNPHIAFFDAYRRYLKLAFKLNDTWFIETVDSSGSVGKWASLAFTSDGLPAISYSDETKNVLRLAVGSFTPPTDSDEDQILDYVEVTLGTDPLDRDTDDDGLSDGEEDANQNGTIEKTETNPKLWDTDNDLLSDGLEIGRTIGISPGPGIKGTDLLKFVADQDPTSTTNPLIPDTDQDYALDGEEDFNHDGREDSNEPDPNNSDTDGDNILDGLELAVNASPIDNDSDDDGLSDDTEDSNLNGIVDANETSLSLFDTDQDSLSDGLEKGVVDPVPDPDGSGKLLGTDLSKFLPDLNPLYNSNPLVWDSDQDMLGDGDEDANRNGAVEENETDFLIYDTDGDGLSDGDERSFRSDPLDSRSTVTFDTVLTENFQNPSIPAQWLIVDEGNFDVPSNWFIWDNALSQGSNIYGGNVSSGGNDPVKPGTFIWASQVPFMDYKISFKMQSQNTGALGLMFNFQDEQNYYRFSMNRDNDYRQVIKKVQNQLNVLNFHSFKYIPNTYYDITIYTIQGRIQIYMEGIRIFDLQDSSLSPGSIAFYSWRNPMAMFKDLTLISGNPITGIIDNSINIIQKFDILQENYKNIISWQISPHALISKIELVKYNNFVNTTVQTNWVNSNESILENNYIDEEPWLADGYALIIYNSNNEIIEKKYRNSIDHIREFSFSEAYPSPSNNLTYFAFQTPHSVIYRYEIYDVLGKKVRTFEGNLLNRGWNQIVWDGRDNHGNLTAVGIYFIRLEVFKNTNRDVVLSRMMRKIIRIP
jgi:hypothetical protein